MKAGLDQRNLAYNKGALVFDMLSREVGVQRFREMMRELTGRGPSTISWTQFTEAVNGAAGRDMGWFWDQWLNRTGAPEFQLAWTQDAGSVRATITQTEPVYRTRLVVEAKGKRGERARQVVEMTGARLEVEFAAGFDVDSLVLDPDYEVLRWTPQFRAMVDSARTRTP
jgi:aminopeptidase N